MSLARLIVATHGVLIVAQHIVRGSGPDVEFKGVQEVHGRVSYQPDRVVGRSESQKKTRQVIPGGFLFGPEVLSETSLQALGGMHFIVCREWQEREAVTPQGAVADLEALMSSVSISEKERR